MLAQRDHRGHAWTTDDRELPSPPPVLEDPDDRDPQDILEEALVATTPEGKLVTDGGDEWDPEPAALREGEQTDERTHAARNVEQLRKVEDEGITTLEAQGICTACEARYLFIAEADRTPRDRTTRMCDDCEEETEHVVTVVYDPDHYELADPYGDGGSDDGRD